MSAELGTIDRRRVGRADAVIAGAIAGVPRRVASRTRTIVCTLGLLLAGPAACTNAAVQTGAGETDLVRHWVRSYEEDLPGDSVQVLRPAGSREFPPSRFRMAYRFAADGTCEWLFLSPDDAHRFKPGSWTIERGTERLLRIEAEGVTTTFRIVELTPSVLRLIPRSSE